MIENGTGGANTTTDKEPPYLITFFSSQPNYYLDAKNEVFYCGKPIAQIFLERNFYSNFLAADNINWQGIISRQIIPNEAIFVYELNTVFIIERKTQKKSGSTDEKLGACAFKKRQYEKLLQGRCNVKIIYLLNNWFNQTKYTDILNYIRENGCECCFDYIPPEVLGLPY